MGTSSRRPPRVELCPRRTRWRRRSATARHHGGRPILVPRIPAPQEQIQRGYPWTCDSNPARASACTTPSFQNLAGLEVVEAHETELASRRRSDHRTVAPEAVESLRTEPAAAAAVSVDDRDDGVSVPPTSGGLVDDYSVSQTTLEQVFVRFAAKQREETAAAPGLGGRFGGAAAAMDDDAPPPKKKGCCSCCCCCCEDH